MKSRSKSALFSVILLAAGVAARAAVPPTPFTLIGPIEKFALDTPATSACGSSIDSALISSRMTVHGIEVVIPCNLIIQMPATYLTADDIFRPGAPGARQSGLALADTDSNKPLAAFEATIVGNIVDNGTGKSIYVAGLVYISQHSLATGAGYIKKIDLSSRVIFVGSDPVAPPSPQDARVRINDGEGVYDHKPFTKDVDKRFTVDTENPTIRALTGYPMCLPSDAGDRECPATNRVAGGVTLRNFVMGRDKLDASPPDALDILPCPACDPTKQAPFMQGDYVSYSGTLAKDDVGLYISAHTVVANVGIFTARGTDPAYVALDESLVGTIGPQTPRDPAQANGPFLPQETQDRLKIEGFTTDPSRNVEIYALDVDPGSGAQTPRLLFEVRPQSVPFGRFRLIVGKRAGILFDSNNNVKGATRELQARIKGSNVQYTAPVGEYIFPENTVLGDPLVPNNFECLSFLQLGSGPLDHTGPKVGRLSPWPGPVKTPIIVNCSP